MSDVIKDWKGSKPERLNECKDMCKIEKANGFEDSYAVQVTVLPPAHSLSQGSEKISDGILNPQLFLYNSAMVLLGSLIGIGALELLERVEGPATFGTSGSSSPDFQFKIASIVDFAWVGSR